MILRAKGCHELVAIEPVGVVAVDADQAASAEPPVPAAHVAA